MQSSKKKNKYIGSKIAKLRKEGMPEKQSIAVAMGYARKKGYNVPKEKTSKS